jgi:hypothetical protein
MALTQELSGNLNYPKMKMIFKMGPEWKGFEAPEIEHYVTQSPFAIVDGKVFLDERGYDRDYAATRTNAYPILNPEIIGFSDIEENQDYGWRGDFRYFGKWIYLLL